MSQAPPTIVENDIINFPVVGIGASAGGLDAFKNILKAIPEQTGMAYLLIYHLSAEYDGNVPELLAGTTTLPVLSLTDDLNLQPDHIYIIPPDKILTTVDGVLKLTDRGEESTQLKIIDLFLSALAVVYQNFAVGVVLSGTSSDGTSGLKMIKSYGGITFAQDDSSAHHGMPQSAIRSGIVDFILAPEDIPGKLQEINRPFHTIEQGIASNEQFSGSDEEILRHILTLLRLKKNVDFTYYKQTTIKRRIVRRMALNKINQPSEYLAHLRSHKHELDTLYADMLISVTGFFRDPRSFDLLCSKVLPGILKHKAKNDTLRIWVAGCATGEEAYSISICLFDILREHHPGIKLQIFATDISEKAINKARLGFYDKSDLEGLSPAQVEKFFIKTDGGYQVIKAIRESCVFALHNLLKDPPFARMDLISCRNVLIYMDAVLQKKAFQTFHYALNEHGILMLGKSETPGTHAAGLFNRINNHEKIYSKKGSPERNTPLSLPHSESIFVPQNKKDSPGKDLNDYQKTADDIVLARFAPPGVVVTEQFDIVQFRGSTGMWLEPSPGKASFNLLKMAKEGLSFELRNILHKVKQTEEAVRKENISVVINGEQRMVTIEAMPLANTTEPYYLVLFQRVNMDEKDRIALEANQQLNDLNSNTGLRDLRISQLEKELSVVREDMRSITEEQEAANEELQSANEELLSSSEELRSLNEELETSQEELRSTNEELSMLNHELLDRNDQLTNARDYAEAILDTVRDPILILDKDLRVRSVTKGFYEKFKTHEGETEGRFFYDLKSCPWNCPELVTKLEQIVRNNDPFTDFELTCNFPALGERIVLVSARSVERINDEQLIIVSVEDVTLSKLEKNELRESNKMLQERIQLAVEATGMGTWDFNPETESILFDDQCRRLFGYTLDEPVNYESFRDRIAAEDRKYRDNTLRNALTGIHDGAYEIEYRIIVDGEIRWIKSKGRAFFTSSGKAYRLVGTMLDVTKEHVSEQLLKESEQRFRLAADSASAMIWMSGPDMLCNYFNKSWMHFTGRTQEQELGDGWKEGVHPDDLNRIQETYIENFRARKEFYMEYRLRRYDGEYRWVSDAASPRMSPDGLFEGYVGICLDIHDQKLTTDELERIVNERTHSLSNAVNELETSNQNLEEFAYVASHDLQEPLRKIQTFASFLQQTSGEQLPADTKLYLSKIKDASNRMGQLIDDILSYSRLKSTDDKLEDTDLNEVVKQVLTDFDLKINERKAVIETDKLPVIKAVPLRMHQLFQNLISNALKFAGKDNAPHIKLTSTELSREEVAKYSSLNKDLHYVNIEVSDNGIGFDQEFAEKVFVIFQRLNGRSEYEGTGIGLAICRKIVINHHGLIFARSEKGKGATFQIILPVVK